MARPLGAAMAACIIGLPFCVAWVIAGRPLIAIAAVAATLSLAFVAHHYAWTLSELRDANLSQAAIAYTPDLVVEFDEVGTYLRVAGYHAFLYPATDNAALGKRLPDVVPPDVAITVLTAIREAKRTGERQIITYHLPIPSTDQEWWESHVAPTGVGTYVLIARDITTQVRREQELRESESFNRTLAYSAGHDLGKGLAAASKTVRAIGAQLLCNEPLITSEKQEFGRALLRQADYMDKNSALATELNGLLRLTSPRDMKRSPVDMFEVVGTASHMVDGEVSRVVAWEISPDLPTVIGERALLTRACENLFSNAVKYSRPAVDPVIHVRRDGNAILVEDNGRGWDPARTGEIWLPGKRLHGGSAIPGNGLGLTTVKRIIELLGGTIKADAEPDRGARFTITLPLAE